MKVTLVATAPADIPADALAIPIATGQRLSGAALDLDRALGGLLSELLANSEFKGRIHEVLPVPTQQRIAARRVILYGIGAIRDLDGQRLRSAHHELVRAARTYGYKRVALARVEPLDIDSLAAVVEGCVMGTFERRSRQTGAQPERVEIDELVITGFGDGREREVVAAQEAGEATNHRSPISRNSEYGEAGTILGGMFIGEFVRGKPWVHLDIAASSWNTNSELTTVLRGSSGAGTRLCIELAELMSKAAR